MKVISFSLFGYKRNYHNTTIDFRGFSYMLIQNLRAYKVLLPEWTCIVHIDKESFNSPFKTAFKILQDNDFCRFEIIDRKGDQLCKRMLWRMIPLSYASHTACRDIDSPICLNDRIVLNQWVKDDTDSHGICDSESHNVPYLGGLCGFKKNAYPFQIELLPGKIQWALKGADQIYLQSEVFKKVKSISQFYFKGYHFAPHSVRHPAIPQNTEPEYEKYRESNNFLNHFGQAGLIGENNEKYKAFFSKFCENNEVLTECERIVLNQK